MSQAPGQWSRGHAACINCGTVARPHAGSGCCSRCHPIWLRRRAADNWDPAQPGPWEKWPQRGWLDSYRNASVRVLSLHKAEIVRQLDARLGRLQYEERLSTGPVTALELEYELERVWEHVRPRPSHKASSPFSRGAGWIAAPFGPQQMTALSKLLIMTLEHVPWHMDQMPWLKSVGRVADQEKLAAFMGG